jgi:predicted nucleic acid-binding Zn ribbon protein
MTPDKEPEATPPKVPCPVCAEPISPAAKKCIHCESFLDARRHLHFSSTVLALLVALVSVVTTALPVVQKALTPDDSDLNLVFLPGGLTVMATNSGTKAGIIEAGLLLIGLAGSKMPPYSMILAVAGSDAGATFVPPGQSKRIRFESLDYSPQQVPDEIQSFNQLALARCTLVIDVIEHRGKKKTFRFEKSCLNFAEEDHAREHHYRLK